MQGLYWVQEVFQSPFVKDDCNPGFCKLQLIVFCVNFLITISKILQKTQQTNFLTQKKKSHCEPPVGVQPYFKIKYSAREFFLSPHLMKMQ